MCCRTADIHQTVQLVTSTSKLTTAELISSLHFVSGTVYVACRLVLNLSCFPTYILGLQESAIPHPHPLLVVLEMEPRALGMAGKCSTPEHVTTPLSTPHLHLGGKKKDITKQSCL